MKKKIFAALFTLIVTASLALLPATGKVLAEEPSLTEGTPGAYDVVVYGATSAGVTAAIAAKKEGANVILVSQNNHIGGLTSSGLGATDMANKNVVGSLSKDFYNRVYEYYRDESAWTSETESAYYEELDTAVYKGKDDALQMMWVFEPKVAYRIFKDMLIEADVPVAFNERVLLSDEGIVTQGGRITRIKCQSGNAYSAKVFIDATYEGDVMAYAGVTYRVGREANAEYNESMNGILSNENEVFGVSPYIVANDPDSGVLPFIEDSPLGENGEADGRMQAYCFRFTLTTDPENRMPITKPENYHPEWFEMRARRLAADPSIGHEFTLNRMPNLKTDTNHADFVGNSYEYADGDYLSRQKIEEDHRDYALNLLYFYAYDERVPLAVRKEIRNYGLAKDEFTDNGNFPVQIYLREGRRMVSDYVMKEGDVIQKEGTNAAGGVIPKLTAPYSIGQGFYWFDSHRVAYYTGGETYGNLVATDGNFWSSRRDYPISYKSVVPNKAECANLYVPVCLSATHAAYGSVRMETTYMILGESCGTAAAMSAAEMKTDVDFAVQDLNYTSLALKLQKNGQLLGDVAVPDYTDAQATAFRFAVTNTLTPEEAPTLEGYLTDGFADETAVTFFTDTVMKAAKKINENATAEDAVGTLTNVGALTAANAALVAYIATETPPAAVTAANGLKVLKGIGEFLMKPAANGYIYDWTNRMYEAGVIGIESVRYFNVYANPGKNPDVGKAGDLLYAIARTIHLEAERSQAITVIANVGVSINAATWQPVVDGTASSVAGKDFNTILSRIEAYFASHEDVLASHLGVFYADGLEKAGVLDSGDYVAFAAGAVKGEMLESALAVKFIVAAAQYADLTATKANALAVLKSAGIILDETKWTAVMEGADAAGEEVAGLAGKVLYFVEANPGVEPITQAELDALHGLGILTEADVTAWSGVKTTNKIDAKYVTRLGSRVATALGGSSIADSLISAGIMPEAMRAAILQATGAEAGTMLEERVPLAVFHAITEYVPAHNTTLTDAQISSLIELGIITDAQKADVKKYASQFGYMPKQDVSDLFAAMGGLLDSTATTLDAKLSALASIGAMANKDSWLTLFADETVVDCIGNNVYTVISLSEKYVTTTAVYLNYLQKKGAITQEQASYWLLNAKKTLGLNTVKLQELMTSLGKALDSGVTNASDAVAAFVANGITTSPDVWNRVATCTDETVDVTGLSAIIERVHNKVKSNENVNPPISGEILDWFAARYKSLSGGAFYGNNAIDQATAESRIKEGETFSSTENTAIMNTVVRVIRTLTGSKGAARSGLTSAITKYASDFDYGSDAELKTYWEARYPTAFTGEVDGGKVKALMEAVYSYKMAKA